MIDYFFEKKRVIGIFVIWLFHLSGIIGMSIGFKSWFLPMTPLNLLINFALLIWIFPINGRAKWMVSLICFLTGMVIEWIGVNTEVIFGVYYYGDNLGPKVEGIPILIGVNWIVLVLITGEIAATWMMKSGRNPATSLESVKRVFLGAGLMIFLDFFIEHSAAPFDFWHFDGGLAGVHNYLGWLGVSAFLQAIYTRYRISGNYLFSLNLYLAQLVFFGWFYVRGV